ncbi:MAG: amidohydrolase family protein [Dehalococcoidia bacterium]
MIVDVHCHIWERSMVTGDMEKMLHSVNAHFGFQDLENIFDGSGERLLADMDEAGIDKSVIVALDPEFTYRAEMAFPAYNDYVGKLIREHRDRLIGFTGIDPRRGKAAISELERCMEGMGFRGVKMWPLTGFYPDDEAFYPFYQRAEQLGAVVLCHTGMGPPPTYLKFNRPVYLDKVAVDFPGIKIIMAHVGQPWVEEAVGVAYKNPNVYVDISGWQLSFKKVPLTLSQCLASAKAVHGSVGKILFGSDWPLMTEVMSQKEWVETIRSLEHPPPLQVMGLPEITEEDKKMILGGNAAGVLGL